jgi:hypothetical protein
LTVWVQQTLYLPKPHLHIQASTTRIHNHSAGLVGRGFFTFYEKSPTLHFHNYCYCKEFLLNFQITIKKTDLLCDENPSCIPHLAVLFLSPSIVIFPKKKLVEWLTRSFRPREDRIRAKTAESV